VLRNSNKTPFDFVPDKPSPPRNLEVFDITAETVELKWVEPEDDGGSAVKHYVVEKMNLQRNTWQEVGQPTECQLRVGDLHDQNKYLFRVAAVNSVGVSDWAGLAEPVTAKHPFSKNTLSIRLMCEYHCKFL